MLRHLRHKAAFALDLTPFARLVPWGICAAASLAACGAPSDGAAPGALDTTPSSLEAPLELLPGAALEIPSIGTGFSAPAEKYMGRCVVGDITQLVAANAAATLKVTSMLDGDKAQQQLGFELGAKAHFGIGQGSLQAQAASAMTRDAFSSVWVLSVSYVSEAAELDFDKPVRPSVIGQAALAANAWTRECGDEFIYQVQKGAQLFVVYRLDYKSENLKEQVEAEAQGQKGIMELNGNLKQLSDQLAKHASLSLEVYQFGGDPTRLGGVITGPEANVVQAEAAAKAVIQCGTDNLQACDQLLTKALIYATSTTAEYAFAQQAQRAANPTLYVTAPWSRLGHLPTRVPTDPDIQNARLGLAMAFDRTLAAKKRVELLLGSDWIDADQRDELLPYKSSLTYQQGRILGLINACYDDLKLDPDAEAAYTAPTRKRCIDAQSSLTHGMFYPPPSILRGAVERALTRTWETHLQSRGDDPARRTQMVGQVTCGFSGEDAVCGYRGGRGTGASVLDGAVFDAWAHLPDDVRERFAALPEGNTHIEGDIAWASFSPQGAVFARRDGTDPGLLLAGPLWRCWRQNAKSLGLPVQAFADRPEDLDTMATFENGRALVAEADAACLQMPAAALETWLNQGGKKSCLGAPKARRRKGTPQLEAVTCFKGGHIIVDPYTQEVTSHCPWFRHAACR